MSEKFREEKFRIFKECGSKARIFSKPTESKPPTPQPKRVHPSRDNISARWIHEDQRGEIFCFYKDNIEYTVLTTRKGFARGGCVHKLNDEYFVVLKGAVKYFIFHPDFYVTTYLKGSGSTIPNNVPHYLIALEDSITLEWGATVEEKQEKHKPTRRIVDEINENNLR